MTTMRATDSEQRENPPVKKPYEIPRLEAYGDVREIARNVGLVGMLYGFLVLRTR